LFLDWERQRRMRVNGVARVSADDPLLPTWPGAQLVTRVAATRIFPNCPRYIHAMQMVELSPFAPRPDYEPPRPAWKDNPDYRDALPKRDLRP
jgi:hypothetical protein